MNESLNQKVVVVTPPRVINDNTAYTTTAVDTRGWRYVTFLIILGALDIAVAALKLQESDDSGMSGAADITGADFSVSPATLPSATDDNGVFAIHVDTRGRMRYLDLVFTAGDGAAGTYATVIAVLSRGEAFPKSASDRGLTAELFV